MKNREIKFRAWDKKNKIMGGVWGMNKVSLCLWGELENDGSWRDIGEFEIMQYTNLKDKNGVEIYEGDIVLNPIRDEKELGITDRRWEVKFYQGGFHLFETDSVCADFREWWEQVEVIGNIYENPELLK